MPKKVYFDIERCFVDRIEIGLNQALYVCRHPTYACPLGLVWGMENYVAGKWTVFEVYGSNVVHWARRCGVRTLINDAILRVFKVIQTRGASKMGRKFMKARGYKYDTTWGYILTLEQYNRRKAKKRKQTT